MAHLNSQSNSLNSYYYYFRNEFAKKELVKPQKCMHGIACIEKTNSTRNKRKTNCKCELNW